MKHNSLRTSHMQPPNITLFFRVQDLLTMMPGFPYFYSRGLQDIAAVNALRPYSTFIQNGGGASIAIAIVGLFRMGWHEGTRERSGNLI